jgi:hypothetical protein
MTTTPNILQRINAAMQEVDYVQKEKKQGMNYSIVSHDAVTAKVRPILVKHGIVYYPAALNVAQDGNRTQVQMSVKFCNIDNPDDFIHVESLGYGIDPQDKGPGKAISYAVKYALLKCLGLETGDDPDLDQSVTHEKPAVMPAVNGTHGASKAANRDTYAKMVQAIHNAASTKSLTDWYKANVTEIDALPADWLDQLRVEYSDRLSELKKVLA